MVNDYHLNMGNNIEMRDTLISSISVQKNWKIFCYIISNVFAQKIKQRHVETYWVMRPEQETLGDAYKQLTMTNQREIGTKVYCGEKKRDILRQ